MSNVTLLPRPIHHNTIVKTAKNRRKPISNNVKLLPRPIHPSLYEANHQLACRVDKFEVNSDMRYLGRAYGFEDDTQLHIYLYQNCLFIKDIYANFHCKLHYLHPAQDGVYNINTVNFVILMEGIKVLDVIYKDYNTTLPDWSNY